MISTVLSVHLLTSFFTPIPSAPAADDVLLIEKVADARGRARAAQRFAKIRVDLHASEMTMQELARFCTAATGDTVNFLVFAKGKAADELPKLTASIAKRSLLQVMGVVQSVTEMRFVYRSGVILMKPKDEVREAKYLRVYDISAAVAPLRDHPGPKLGLVPTGSDALAADLPEDTDKTLSGWNIDQIQDLLRQHVAPESWDADGVTMSANRGALWVRQSLSNQKKVRKLLLEIGVIQRVRIVRKQPIVYRHKPTKAIPEKAAKAEKSERAGKK